MPGISDLRQPMLIYDAGLLALRLLAVSDFGSGGGGGLTDAELRAAAVQVSAIPDGDNPFKTELLGSDGLTVATFTDTSLNVNITGASTADLATTTFQSVGNNSLSSIDGKLTNPLPVSLPAGFSTSALQTTGNTSLGTINTNTAPLVVAGAGGYVRQDSTGTIAKETGGNLATVNTNTAPLVVAAAGGYVRQDSTATIAKESGGNLATLVTNTTSIATAALQTSGNASLTTIAALSKAEDAAAVDADTGIAALAVRQDVPQSTSGAIGDYNWMTTDAQGRLWVNSDVLGELSKRSNDLLLAKARLAADHLRFQSMISGAFQPVPEVW